MTTLEKVHYLQKYALQNEPLAKKVLRELEIEMQKLEKIKDIVFDNSVSGLSQLFFIRELLGED